MSSNAKAIIFLNVTIAFFGGTSAMLGSFLVRRYVEAPWNEAFAMSGGIFIGLMTPLLMMVATALRMFLDKRQESAGAELQRQVEEQVESIAVSLLHFKTRVEFRLEESALTQLPDGMPSGLFLALAEPIVHKYRDLVEHIVRGTRRFSVREYYREACQIMSSLVAGDRVEAVCADVKWGLVEAIHYFVENAAAAIRGASVTRIFVVPTSEISRRLREVMDKHYDAGARVLLLTKDSELYRNLPELFLPDGVGFVLLTRNGELEARLHFSSHAGSDDFGRLYRQPEVVQVLQVWFDELKRLAEVYEPVRVAEDLPIEP